MSMSAPAPSPRKRSRARAAAPAVIPLALGAAAAVPWLLWGHSASSPPQAGARPTAASPPGTGRAPAPAASTDVSTAGWHAAPVDGAPVPESPSSGPYRVSGGLAAGYADTPSGAVLAAVNIDVRTSGQVGSAVFAPTIENQVTGTWQQTLLAGAWSEYQQSGRVPGNGGPSAAADVSVTAFKVDSWSPRTADITLLATADGSAGEQVTATVQLTWSGNDWKLVAPAHGQFAATRAAAGLPAGFTRLPGLPQRPAASAKGGKQ